ncbi:hypothetical protein F383_35691 [Gossypium arboreum]|uniref:Uncharacterized protein n=1 Tax=Gossypium arboreum TaxID=29729 RepID=A0A0B0N712_GOSAR|nr:hypothetical protein F383_35691 [Gossypium arboreum]
MRCNKLPQLNEVVVSESVKTTRVCNTLVSRNCG